MEPQFAEFPMCLTLIRPVGSLFGPVFSVFLGLVLVPCGYGQGAEKIPPTPDSPFVLRWHGQSFFELTTPKGVRVVFDPHAIEAYGRKTIEADLVLLSHLHTDHTRLEPITNKDKAKVLNGLKPSMQQGRGPEFNPVDEAFKEINIKTVSLYHDSMEGLHRGRNAAWVLAVEGLKIVHLGDLGHKLTRDQLRQIGPVDVLMIPVGGVYTINGADAKEIIDQLKPKRLIFPMHHATRVYEDLLGPEEFLEDLPKERLKKLLVNKYEFRASDPIPKAPLVVMPNFE